jgi:hypothetical protein
MSYINMSGNIHKKGLNPGAFTGKLICPTCQSNSNRFVENIGPTRIRYRCRKCGVTFQYDFSGLPDQHPYAPLSHAGKLSGKIRDVIARGRQTNKRR